MRREPARGVERTIADGARHRCSGLVLWTSRPVPGLETASPEDEIDVEAWLGDDPPWRDEPGEVTRVVHESPHLYRGRPTLVVTELDGGRWFRMAFSDDIDFVLDAAGGRVWATWADYQTLEDAATYLLGPVLGYLLRRRGVTGLHASAVAIDGRAVALVGPAGTGKSTTAAAFAREGWPVLSDDFVPLAEEEGRILARPAFPLIRLWSESARLLYGSPDALPVLAPNWQKRVVDLRARGYAVVTEPLELAALYLFGERLDDPAAPRVEPEPTASGFLALVANTNATFLMDRAMRAAEFRFLSRVTGRVPLRRLHPHARPERLPELIRAVVEDVRSLPGAGA